MQLIDINSILFIDINDILRNYKVGVYQGVFKYIKERRYFDLKNLTLGRDVKVKKTSFF